MQYPLTAADYLDYPRMRAIMVAINNTPTGRCCRRGNYDVWGRRASKAADQAAAAGVTDEECGASMPPTPSSPISAWSA